MTDRPTTADDQLPLPITASSTSNEPATRRGRRKRVTDRQLWLFVPYMQPELPLAHTGQRSNTAPQGDDPVRFEGSAPSPIGEPEP